MGKAEDELIASWRNQVGDAVGIVVLSDYTLPEMVLMLEASLSNMDVLSEEVWHLDKEGLLTMLRGCNELAGEVKNLKRKIRRHLKEYGA